MSIKSWIALLLATALLVPMTMSARSAPQGDFLTQDEADQIRNAESANARVGLFLDFAADRLKRFEQQIRMKGTGPLRADFLNDLLDSFSACVDEASGRVDDAMSNGVDVRRGIRDFRKRVPKFLDELKKIKKEGIDLHVYQDSLEDATSDLRADLRDVEKAAKQSQFNSPSQKPGGREHD